MTEPQSYPSSIFSGDSDLLASDIEADLQELSLQSEDIIASPSVGSIRSVSSTNSLLTSHSNLMSPDGSTQSGNIYLRSVPLKGAFTNLLNVQLTANSGSSSCIVNWISYMSALD